MAAPWGRIEGCEPEGRGTIRKESRDHEWSVAIGREGVKEGRRMWELRLSGKTGRMSVGVARSTDAVLMPEGGWIADACEGQVWHYSSTGGIRDGPSVLYETGVRYSEGDTVIVALDMEKGQLHFARAGASPMPIVEVPKGAELCIAVAMYMQGCGCNLREVPLLSPAPLAQLVYAAAGSVVNSPSVSVPRLSLKSVGGDHMARQAAEEASRAGGGSNGSGSAEREIPNHGPLSARASQQAPSGIGMRGGPSPRTGVPLVSPRVGGMGRQPTPRNRADSTGTSSVGDTHTPRIYEASPDITPRGYSSTGYTPRGYVHPSPRAASGAGMSSGLPSPSGAHSNSPFVSPRYMSPRTPRGLLLTSPRRPLAEGGGQAGASRPGEPLSVTMSLRDHQQLNAAQRRVEQLEERLRLAMQENGALQTELERKNLATLSELGSSPKQSSRKGREVLSGESSPVGECDESGESEAGSSLSLSRGEEEEEEEEEGIDGEGEEEKSEERMGGVAMGGLKEVGHGNASLFQALGEERRKDSVRKVDVGVMAAMGGDGSAEGAQAIGASSSISAGGVGGGECKAAEEGGQGQEGVVAVKDGEGMPASELLGIMGWELNPRDLRVERCIGRGSAGSVYVGTWRGARVAIKEVDVTESDGHGGGEVRQEIADSFRQEVAALSKLRHPHVIAFYGATTHPPILRLVTEMCDCDLRHYLKGDGKEASLSERVGIAVGAACGLAYLHSQSPPLVHRDVKPENFLLSSASRVVKVCDFGLARDKHRTFLQTIHHGGTLVYIAPEVHRGQDFDEGCDVYAFAVVVWELATLSVPFDDKAPQSIPGIVGWGGQRPSMSELEQTIKQLPGTGQGAGLERLRVLVEECWGQDASKRLKMEVMHERLVETASLLESLEGAAVQEIVDM